MAHGRSNMAIVSPNLILGGVMTPNFEYSVRMKSNLAIILLYSKNTNAQKIEYSDIKAIYGEFITIFEEWIHP